MSEQAKRSLAELANDIKSSADEMRRHLDEQKRKQEEERRAREEAAKRARQTFGQLLASFLSDVVAPAIGGLKHAFPDMKMNTSPTAIKLPSGVYHWRDGKSVLDATFSHPDPSRLESSNRKCRFLLVATDHRQEVTLIADVADSPNENLKSIGSLTAEQMTREGFEELLRGPVEAIKKSIPRLSPSAP